MTEYLPRSAWTKVAKPLSGNKTLTPIVAGDLRGVAVHYTGSTAKMGTTATLALSAKRLEAERVFHVNDRGWSDIAYSYAIDQEGRVFELRGLDYRCAANGDQEKNQHYHAVTILIGQGDKPTPAAVEAFVDWRNDVFLKRFPHATAVVGHRDLFGTDCPGDPAYALVKNGTFAVIKKTQEVDPVTDVSVVSLTDAMFSEGAARYKVRRPNGSTISPVTATSEIYGMIADLATAVGALGKQVAAVQASQLDPAKLNAIAVQLTSVVTSLGGLDSKVSQLVATGGSAATVEQVKAVADGLKLVAADVSTIKTRLGF